MWGDRIAGFYAADAPRRGRSVEAYCWGGMTSRSSSRVLWLLLFPFMLANVAGWTCSARIRRDRWMFAVHRACGRLAALAVTLNLLLTAAMVAMDVWAYQFCGRDLPDGSPWIKRMLHAPLDGLGDGRRVVVGAGLVLADLLVIALLTRRTRSRYEDVTPVGAPARTPMRRSAAALPDGVTHPRFYDSQATVRRLARLHLGAGVAWLGLLLAHVGAGGRFDPVTAGPPAAVLAIAIGLTAVEAAGDWLLLPLTVAAGLTAGWVAFRVWTGARIDPVTGHLDGMLLAVKATFALILVLAVAWVLLVPLIALLRLLGLRRGVDTGAPVDRKWLAAPFMVAVLSIVSINVVGLGCVIAVGKALGSVRWEIEGSVRAGELAMFPFLLAVTPWLTLAPAAVTIVFLLVESMRWVAAGRGGNTAPIVAEYAGRAGADPPPQPPWDVWRRSALPQPGMSAHFRRRALRWVRSIAQARKLATFPADARYLAAGIVVVVLLLPALYRLGLLSRGRGVATFADDLAVSFAVVIPCAGVLLLRWGWRRPGARRWLGVLWDVGTFWPRAYHPFAPPCYAERAVPDLQRRIRFLRDTGARVVLVGHSQGSVLAAATLAQQPDPDTVLVTFGSPLTTLYGWGFPAYINRTLCDRVRNPWLNFSYRTDYIGGPVGCPGADVVLPDPATSWYIAGEPMPPMRRHTGYWSDEAMWTRIDEALATRPVDVPEPFIRGPARSPA
ncbi:hypothetical protein FHX34_105754 [Actinoplanes teichomyceticus]|uniref:Lipase (Class 3) n=1 Tax=Actinoplanes teichomyceticus TaxID=1867 RepID=A0A561VMN5_ACTTI|nr:hypothetical protein FHX34_105754 [Actinoplanes teichomyceticus]GIF13636.1 hypothetical protein Ate01nite_36680 [Actinoplanes teichomyceticus]